MKYEDARRLRGVESAWLRLSFWWHSIRMDHRSPAGNLNDLPDYLRRDIGLPEPARYMDWRALEEASRR